MYVDFEARDTSISKRVFEVLHEAVHFVVFPTTDACRLHHRRILDCVL